MGWGFSEALSFAVFMTLRDMSKEKNKRLIKTQKFYQECYERIADDSAEAFNVVSNVVHKASRKYIPAEIGSGCTYLPLYAFSLVIEKQGRVTSEQKKIINLYFDNMNFPFSQSAYLNAVRTGADVENFKSIMFISDHYIGEFWVHFFRALYKSGTQKELQSVVDYTTSMIQRFSVLGNPDSKIANGLCEKFIESVNYQINQVREISIKEVDWLGIVPIPDRLEEIKNLYEYLIDNSNITDDMSKSELLPYLDLLILNCVCDIVMMTKQPKSVKINMMHEATKLSCIDTYVTPEQYVSDIANNTEMGNFYKTMFSAGSPLGAMWRVIITMGGQIDKKGEPLAIINGILSILLQIENYLDEKYNFLGAESIARDYMLHIVEQLAEICNEGE